ncbi:carboxymuconolactone decarboxylase family protein [bacterium]|nr:carboxymuconolactone decarboxylase family protein [bacterium]
MGDELKEFREYREKMNDKILSAGNLDIRRFFAIDTSVYRDGALDAKTKELLGLVASTVMRCNDCILYHLIRCIEENAEDEEIHETLSIALIVGGSITIPHLRYAFDMLDKLRQEEK